MKEGGAGHPGAKALVVLAAGMSSRYGRLKQLEPVGPGGEALLDYAVFDAVQAGFRRVVFVIRPEIEEPFRAHVAPLLDAGADLRFAYQSLDDLPAGRSPSDGRAKPWGTAHAVWAARHQVEGPFAVCNADDFYGADGYKKLADFLDEGGECGLVGYRLANTLSPHGGVSRGLVQSDPQGSVTGVVEALDLRLNQVTGTVEGRTDDGESVNVDPGSLVSMNLWGFRVEVFTHLERLFEEEEDLRQLWFC